MSATNDGGPAFPSPTDRTPSGEVNSWAEYGMSLRDYFAGMALQGLLASGHFTVPADEVDQAWMTVHKDEWDDETGEKSHPGRYIFDFPEAAWKCADSMIKARATGKGPS